MSSYDPEPAGDLLDQVGRLQLHRHVAELAIAGYTVLLQVLTPAETTRLRAADRGDPAGRGPARMIVEVNAFGATRSSARCFGRVSPPAGAVRQ
jgi:hypothetical protein